MALTIGFVVLNHRNPGQLERLLRRLDKTFDAPPIVCHNDFGQCPLDVSAFPKRVTFVAPHVETRWADISLVHAFLRALRLLYRGDSAPDWFVLLSGSDYPIRPASELRQKLQLAECDAFIHSRLVVRGSEYEDWNNSGYKRYCCRTIRVPSLTKRLRFTHREFVVPRIRTPFGPDFRCFSGQQWFCGDARAAERLLSQRPEHQRLLKAYEAAQFPDESYCQTVLCNDAGLTVHPEILQYIRWLSPLDAHPKTLDERDLDDMLSSGKYFARKFDQDTAPRVLDLIDQILDGDTGADR